MLAGTVNDAYDRLMIFKKNGAKTEVLAFRIAEGSGSIVDVFVLLF